jgi:hypothetical protein
VAPVQARNWGWLSSAGSNVTAIQTTDFGVIARLGWSGTEDAVICHQCDFAGCTNPARLRLGTNAANRSEYSARRNDLAGPLADVRGPPGELVPAPRLFEPV